MVKKTKGSHSRRNNWSKEQLTNISLDYCIKILHKNQQIITEGNTFVHNRDRKKAHITILKTELAFILAAVVLTAFVLGFFSGKGKGGAVFELDPLPFAEQIGSTSASPALNGGNESAAQPEADDRVDINTADPTQLTTLPGIGEVLAGRIMAYREEVGRFNNIYELMDVSGIGEKTFEKLESLIRVG